MYVSAVRHGAVRENGAFSGRNTQLKLTHPEKPAYSRMIMGNQKGFTRYTQRARSACFVPVVAINKHDFLAAIENNRILGNDAKNSW